MAFKLSKDAIDEIASLRGLQKKAKINREISRYRDELESAARKLVVSDKDLKKTNKTLKGIIHIHFLLQNGLR